MKRYRPVRLLIGLLFILTGVGLYVTSDSMFGGRSAHPGRITKVEAPVPPTGGKTAPQDRLRVHYHFRDFAGEERSGFEDVDFTGRDHPFQPGREVLLSYQRNDPEDNRIASSAGEMGGVVVVLLAGVAIVGLAVFAGRSRRSWRCCAHRRPVLPRAPVGEARVVAG